MVAVTKLFLRLPGVNYVGGRVNYVGGLPAPCTCHGRGSRQRKPVRYRSRSTTPGATKTGPPCPGFLPWCRGTLDRTQTATM
jgi:hypothetical protein